MDQWELGRQGEHRAAQALVRGGLRILALNWRCAAAEVDIVALDGDVLVLCEVKTRRSARFGSPAEAVTRARTRRYRSAASLFLREQRPLLPGAVRAIRFDVVCVVAASDGTWVVEHLREAF